MTSEQSTTITTMTTTTTTSTTTQQQQQQQQQLDGLLRLHSGLVDYLQHSDDPLATDDHANKSDDDGEKRDHLAVKSMLINYMYVRMLIANRLPLDTSATMRLIVDTLQLLCARYKCMPVTCASASSSSFYSSSSSSSSTSTPTLTEKMLVELSALVSDQCARSLSFCHRLLVEPEGLRTLIALLLASVPPDNSTTTTTTTLPPLAMRQAVVRSTLSSLVSLARASAHHDDDAQHMAAWRECDAVAALLTFYSHATTDDDDDDENRIRACVVVALVADESQVMANFDSLVEHLIPALVGVVRASTQSMQRQGTLVVATTTTTATNDEQEDDTGDNDDKDDEAMADKISLACVIRALHHLAVHDALKAVIYEANAMHAECRVIVEMGSDVERSVALGLLWQCCFDPNIAADVSNDTHLYALIKQHADLVLAADAPAPSSPSMPTPPSSSETEQHIADDSTDTVSNTSSSSSDSGSSYRNDRLRHRRSRVARNAAGIVWLIGNKLRQHVKLGIGKLIASASKRSVSQGDNQLDTTTTTTADDDDDDDGGATTPTGNEERFSSTSSSSSSTVDGDEHFGVEDEEKPAASYLTYLSDKSCFAFSLFGYKI